MSISNNVLTLIRLEAGLKSELEVLRSSAESDIIHDAGDELKFSLTDAQLEELKRTRDLLQEEVHKAQFRVKRLTRHIRDYNSEELASREAIDDEDEAITEEDVKNELYSLRKRALGFAKEQWPLSQDAEVFEGGDFWDACIASCANQQRPIEYSDREAGFAELLLQAGVAERIDDLGGIKRIRLCREIYTYDEDKSSG